MTLSKLYPNDIPDPETFYNEYYVFCATLKDEQDDVSKSIRDASKFCHEQYEGYGLFPSVWKAFKLFKSASPSVCASERSFSRLKLLKSYLRNKLGQNKLNSLMLISNESDISMNLDLNILTKKWAKMKERRIRL